MLLFHIEIKIINIKSFKYLDINTNRELPNAVRYFLFSQVVVEYLNIHKSDNNFKIKVNNLVFQRAKICSLNFKNIFNRKI